MARMKRDLGCNHRMKRSISQVHHDFRGVSSGKFQKNILVYLLLSIVSISKHNKYKQKIAHRNTDEHMNN